MGNDRTVDEESFSAQTGGLLEYPHYTRPIEWQAADGKTYSVPEILRSGDHAKIKHWRRSRALSLTRERRSDLL